MATTLELQATSDAECVDDQLLRTATLLAEYSRDESIAPLIQPAIPLKRRAACTTQPPFRHRWSIDRSTQLRLAQYICVAVTIASFIAAVPSSWRNAILGGSTAKKAVTGANAKPRVTVLARSQPRTVPIQDIQLGQRVAGRNPLCEQVEKIEPDPATWRAISLEMRKDNGGRLCIELLRPLDWLEAHEAEVGRTIFVDLEEMGAAGEAEVTAIGPCPPIAKGDGAIVTGRFVHESDGQGVIDLRIEGQPEATTVTANHPYWSVDRDDFVPVGKLRIGELLETGSGPRRVESLTEHPNYTGLLYNIETTEHVYEVGTVASLVHNTCWQAARQQFWKAEAMRNPQKYSADNMRLMRAGLAPRMRVEVRKIKAGPDSPTVVIELPMELHHRSLPQRLGSPKANEQWNLEATTPWAHEGMDPYRRTGFELIRLVDGVNRFSF